jgi:CxxC motif-containing protein
MDTTTTTYLCIGCPLGCRLEVDEDQGAIVEIRGYDCKKGKTYAEQEHTDPRRMFTGSVTITGAHWQRLPVKTSREVPRDQITAVAAAVRRLRVAAPVHLGDVLVANILNTGADLVATRDLA